jgi:tRNA (guanosine-2'-O-)-methyltransferase
MAVTPSEEEIQYSHALAEYLAQYLTPNRKATIELVLAARTRFLTVVLEDIFQSHNASAVVRTCECMGLQDLHIIESRSKYGTNKKVLKGSNKWVTINRYKEKGADNIAACYESLRKHGYRILAMDPAEDGQSLLDVPIDGKIALVMGNELDGLSEYALRHADAKVRVPMFGFTESMNVSVTAAISMNILLTRVRTLDVSWQLTENEKDSLRLEWYRKCIRRCEIVEKDFQRNFTKSGAMTSPSK